MFYSQAYRLNLKNLNRGRISDIKVYIQIYVRTVFENQAKTS